MSKKFRSVLPDEFMGSDTFVVDKDSRTLTIKRVDGDVVIREGESIYCFNNGYLDPVKVIRIVDNDTPLPYVEVENELEEIVRVGGGKLYTDLSKGKSRPPLKQKKSRKGVSAKKPKKVEKLKKINEPKKEAV